MSHIVWLDHGKLGREIIGGKGASLAEMIASGFRVPDGFCVTAEAYRYFATSNGLDEQIGALMRRIDPTQMTSVHAAAREISEIVSAAPLPDDLRGEIVAAYEQLCERLGPYCAVRSSAISEDGAGASFAGLYESYLNIYGADSVLDAVHRCFVSLWGERAVGYRARAGGGTDEAMSVVVMGLVPSDTSGIAFTAHPVTGARDLVVINASWGLGEAVVAGMVTPDSFIVDKNTFVVLERDVFTKELQIRPQPEGGGTIEEKVPRERQGIASLTDDQACEVARLAARVEEHYGSPQDIEWGLADGELFLLQSRPITTLG